MSKIITIAPVTRVEGHAKITIHLNEQGEVQDARFHVNEFRGFEKFCEGRLLWEMPGLTSRICGICPASHLVTSAKAGDDILSIGIPETAEKLRRLLTLGQWLQSHALSFFHLSSPDFLLGFDADPAVRNIFGLMQSHKELARRGIRIRKFGQQIIEFLGGRRIHTPWAVAGGVREAFTKEEQQKLLEWYPEVKETALMAIKIIKEVQEKFAKEVSCFGNFHSLFMGMVGPKGELEYYGGNLRIMDSAGNIIADNIDPRDYHKHFGEASESWSYLKFPYYKPHGYPKGMYRVGPLARLNICDFIDSPLAEEERQHFKKLAPSTEAVNNSFYFHYARMIEMLFAVEKVEELLRDPSIFGTHVRSKAEINKLEGVGACEAPRGTLFHHYNVDENGVLQKVNLLIATSQNNMAMNRTVRQIAMEFIDGPVIPEPVINRIEAGIRCFDPCLSCSTHAAGQMALDISLIDVDGQLLDRRIR